MTIDGAEQKVTVSGGDWLRGDLPAGPLAGPVAVSGGWTAAETFTVDLVRTRTPFTARYSLKFAGDEVTMVTRPNVGPVPPPMVGRKE